MLENSSLIENRSLIRNMLLFFKLKMSQLDGSTILSVKRSHLYIEMITGGFQGF